MSEKKIYSGKITSLRQHNVEKNGEVTYEIRFKHKYLAYFKATTTIEKLIQRNCVIEFEGEYVGKNYMITKIHSMKKLLDKNGKSFGLTLEYDDVEIV